MGNLKLWDAVEKTNPNHTKKANVRGNNITAIAPQRQVKNATEQFGIYGQSWGFKAIAFDYAMLELTGIVVFNGVFYFPEGEFPISSSISAYRDNARLKPDADFAKKVETDALTKALSKLGFNADVFMGLYDDHKYVQMMDEEFNKQEPSADDMSWINAIKGDSKIIEQITDPIYKTRIQIFIKEGY
jgi:hypothetical protein